MFLTISGCYSQYPSNWDPLNSGQNECASISGVYYARGSGSRYGIPHLAPRVLQDEKFRPMDAERVQLEVNNRVLTVVVFSAEKQLRSRQFQADTGEYICEGGKIRMTHVVVDALGARRNRIVLSKTLDGALVVEDSGEGLGFFVVPIAGSEYLRFEPYK